jgi:hypothetical protein
MVVQRFSSPEFLRWRSPLEFGTPRVSPFCNHQRISSRVSNCRPSEGLRLEDLTVLVVLQIYGSPLLWKFGTSGSSQPLTLTFNLARESNLVNSEINGPYTLLRSTTRNDFRDLTLRRTMFTLDSNLPE